MPIYDWRCTVCELDVSTLKPFSESDSPPTEQDVADSLGPDKGDGCPGHQFKKVILKAPGLSFTGSWGYGNAGRGKGGW